MSKYERHDKSKKKHPIISSSTPRHPSGTPTSSQPTQRPGWRGPGYIKKTARPPSASPAAAAAAGAAGPKTSDDGSDEQQLPRAQQQALLDIFRRALPCSADFEALKPTLQAIKGALFERDFGRAFGSEGFLEAYAVRWSPSRALCYADVLAGLVRGEKEAGDGEGEGVLGGLAAGGKGEGRVSAARTVRVVCLGGGAAELVAFAGALRHLDASVKGSPASKPEQLENPPPSPRLDLHLIDAAAWSPVLTRLQTSLTTPAPLSKYASAAAKANNAAFLDPSVLRMAFTQQDVLAASSAEITALLGGKRATPALITLLFTLNELYGASRARTTALLLDVTACAPAGSLLLVVDSPGSYSEAKLGGGGGYGEGAGEGEGEGVTRTYPMHWLLLHTLLQAGSEGGPAWEKLVSDESRWFRLGEGLRYPVSLENMRYQVHLFRRL